MHVSIYLITPLPPPRNINECWDGICKSFMECRNRYQPGGPVQQPYLLYRPAKLHSLAESIPRNRFLGSINVYKYGLCLAHTECTVHPREYWMIYREPGFLAVIWFGSSPTHSPLSSQSATLVAASHRKTENERQLADRGRSEGEGPI